MDLAAGKSVAVVRTGGADAERQIEEGVRLPSGNVRPSKKAGSDETSS